MTANTDHHACPQPDDRQVPLWRYMDFAKYVAMLDSSCLHFARVDLLDDAYEGSLPRNNVPLRVSDFKPIIGQYTDDVDSVDLSKYGEWLRQKVFVNCWHMSQHESVAMWKLYASSRDAVAVVSAYDRLAACLPENVVLGRVTYIDYTTDQIPSGSFFHQFMHKRKSFEHEREVRALLVDGARKWMYEARPSGDPKVGIPVKLELRDLIERVHVAPTSPGWFRDLVETITRKYDLDCSVLRSSLDDVPIY